MDVAIEIAGLSKSYPGFSLSDINLSIPAGSIVGLIGQNGAGKTTLIQCVLSLVERDSGDIRLPGSPKDPNGPAIRSLVGYIPEAPTFYEWMKVGRQIRFVSKFYNSWDQQYSDDLLRRYELDANKQIKHLSKGMRAKLALLLALSHRPPVLILDEPTSGLDPLMKHQFLEELRRIVTTGAARAVLVSSHILGEMEQVADRVAILRAGELSLFSETSDFLTGWRKITFQLPGNQRLEGCGDVHFLGDGRQMLLAKEDVPSLVSLLRQRGALDINVTSPDLKDIFLEVA
ncbi:MAG: ABC transporter ATP-binding protein [Blastocatellia bacterium]